MNAKNFGLLRFLAGDSQVAPGTLTELGFMDEADETAYLRIVLPELSQSWRSTSETHANQLVWFNLHWSSTMKIQKLTFVLFILVVGTLGLAFATRNQTQSSKVTDAEALRQRQEKKGKFPIASYDEPELTDPKKNQARKEKKVRHNNFSIVAKNPAEWQAETLFIDEGLVLTPALPVTRSVVIVVGEVKTAEAHVSENRENVYSEFTVLVTKVFKTANSSIIDGAEITIDRIGGFVRYPNGRTVLYSISGKNMPAVGGRYVFFLASPNNQDLIILTAYELGASGVTPLDDSPQFEKFRGMAEDAFLQNLRDSLTESSPH